MKREHRKMVALFERAQTRKPSKVRAPAGNPSPKDRYRDEGVAKVLRAARSPVIDEPMSAAEMMRVIRRRG
jgi:hypothetical protein